MYQFRWMIHDLPPGKDYYNWTERCLSTGAPYNPQKVYKIILLRFIAQQFKILDPILIDYFR